MRLEQIYAYMIPHLEDSGKASCNVACMIPLFYRTYESIKVHTFAFKDDRNPFSVPSREFSVQLG
jgi:hypothetical protein